MFNIAISILTFNFEISHFASYAKICNNFLNFHNLAHCKLYNLQKKENKYNAIYIRIYIKVIFNRAIFATAIEKGKRGKRRFDSIHSHPYFIQLILFYGNAVIKPAKLADIWRNQSQLSHVLLSAHSSSRALTSPFLSFLSFTFPDPSADFSDYRGRNQNHIERPKRRVPSPVGAMRSLGYIAGSAVFSLFMWRNRIKTVATSWVPRWDYSRTVTPGNANPM